MLKDDIKRREEILKRIKKENENSDFIQHEIRGEVEIKGWKNGELFYHDGGSNTVTIWAKHALVRLLSGDSFSAKGTAGTSPILYSQPSPTAGDHSASSPIKNVDGTGLSGYQYFYDYNDYLKYYVNRTSVGTDPTVNVPPDTTPPPPQRVNGGVTGVERVYPFFPTKMLFGTGFEFPSWAATQIAGWDSYLISRGYGQGTFDGNISNTENCISNSINDSTISLINTRTVNDIVASQLTDNEADYADNYGIDGPIKDGLARTQMSVVDIRDSTGSNNIIDTSGYPKVDNIGVGRPAFVYCKRSDHWFTTDTAEIAVQSDDQVKDNRIVFSVVLPEQTGLNTGYYYPYNGGYPYASNYEGMMLKQAGLFCDARLTVKDAIPGTGDFPARPYYYMPGGIMLAKRKISPISKTPEVRISISWSLYL